jgi:hypothetical protein
VYILAGADELDPVEAELFLLEGDVEPRGSRRRLISIVGEMLTSPCTEQDSMQESRVERVLGIGGEGD